ncbi:MAG: type II secretion system minor pseudopilin GspK [Deltaproteobacteria bacterium]|nr:type II secretion system minor pseudopilin GspK [Deltaproteobacteria bacterium]
MLIKGERGVALVLALAVIALLVSLVVDFSYTMMVDLTLAANLRDGQKAFYAARSGVELAKHLLQEDDPAFDALDEDWALLPEHPGFLAADDEGKFKVTIEDEAAKIPMNKLITGDKDKKVDLVVRAQIERLFELLELDPELIDPIIDWLDPDNNPQPFGAEDAYYQGLPSPYPCKNGPLDALEELLLVKGMTKEILYGQEEKKGLIPYLTLYSDGKVNINTASVEVLASLSDKIDNVTAQAIIDYRQKNPFQEIKYDDIKHLPGMTLEIFNDIKDQCDVKSSSFSLRAEGQVREIKKVIYTVLKREEKKGIKPIFWRVE